MTEDEARALTIGAAVQDNGPGIGTVVEKHLDSLSIQWTAPPTRVEGVSTFLYEDMKLISSTGVSLGEPVSAFDTQTGFSQVGVGGYAVGCLYTINTDGQIVAIRYWRDAGDPLASRVCRLWSGTSATLLAATAPTTHSGSGWKEIPLATPVDVVAGQQVVSSYEVYTTGFYVALPNQPPSDTPHLTWHEGRYGAIDSWPNSSAPTQNYGSDVAFRPVL